MGPDQGHIDHVCEALWRRPTPGASVMVGSGFSQYARSIRPDARSLPMLDDLGSALLAKLYPQCPAGEKPRPDQVLRLAQEYEAEFRERGLHDALRALVPDQEFKPGELHKRLLKLRWADVFTTNWDTLLERTLDEVEARAYTVVRTKNDIPSGVRPRIVKLHGSLPDPPLILTEESYRTYPSTFAPLVNMVQQAMMETALLLIGFSGNDPNFLHWSGWVRDNLGDAAPRVYLAGYLDLSRPHRRMLQKRNVIPIDLAQHPKVHEWPEHLRHEYATEWIIATLERAQPYDITKWPKPRTQDHFPEVDPQLLPVVTNDSLEPRAEPRESPTNKQENSRLSMAKETLAVWAHNRDCYPDWLVAPARMRNERRLVTEQWTPIILKELPRLSLGARLTAIREVIWRYEVTLAKIPDDLESLAQETLDAIDCVNRVLEDESDEEIDWKALRESWRDVALALLTAARYRMDAETFATRVRALTPYLNDSVEVLHRVTHERCLWDSWSLDYPSLSERLKRWLIDAGDPFWGVRKSALLREVGEEREAAELVEQAIAKIRAIPSDGRSLQAPSREGWALWSVATYATMHNVQDQWDKLAPLNCDPSLEIHYLSNAVARPNRTLTPHFDLGIQPSDPPDFFPSQAVAAAYRGLRLAEIAGLPLSQGFSDIAGDTSHLLRRASEALVLDDVAMGMRQMIRVATYDKEKGFLRVLSRTRVASLRTAAAEALADNAQTALRYAMTSIQKTRRGRDLYGAQGARVTMEALSRLVVRLDSAAALAVFDYALDLYKNPAVASEFFLHEPLANLLRRSWESLSEAQQTKSVLDILEAPIVGLGGLTVDFGNYPDPGALLSADVVLPERTEANEDRWRSVVGILLRGLRASGTPRERAAARMADVALANRLTRDEASQVAQALWEPLKDDGKGLPIGTSLHDYAFILLPGPRDRIGRKRFGRKWLSGDTATTKLTGGYSGQAVGGTVVHTNPNKADDVLWQVGMAIAFLRFRDAALGPTPAEREYLTGVITQWSGTRLPRTTATWEVVREVWIRSVWNACRGLRWILTEVDIPAALGKRLHEQAQELVDSGIPAYGPLPGIANVATDLREDVALLMSTGLASDDDRMARSAMVSLHYWMRFAADPVLEFTTPPRRLIREIGIAIATRRSTVLAAGLDAAKWVFEEGSEHQRETIRDPVLKGLGYLAEELRYDREDAYDRKLDIPLARWRSAQVARALAMQGMSEHPIVIRWLDLGKDDPLPEVRHVTQRWPDDGQREP